MKLSQFLSVFLFFCLLFPAFSNADQLEDAKTAFDDKDFEKAYELLVPLAEAKNAEAQTRLGMMYLNGQGVEMDLTEGLRLIMAAAKQGYDVAQACALDVCMDMAREGDAGAMYNVAGMCLKGWGGEQDKNVCLKWLEEAARLGHENSGKMLNKIYSKGMYGIAPDEEKAAYWKDLLAAYEAGLDGTWSGEIPSAFGGPPMKMTFTFETDGNELAGTTPGFGGRDLRIEDGEISGKDFSFKIEKGFGEMKSTDNYTGEFYGDTIKLTYTTTVETRKQRGKSTLNIDETGGGMGDQDSPPITFIAKRTEI
jgi:hypothetical protein